MQTSVPEPQSPASTGSCTRKQVARQHGSSLSGGSMDEHRAKSVRNNAIGCTETYKCIRRCKKRRLKHRLQVETECEEQRSQRCPRCYLPTAKAPIIPHPNANWLRILEARARGIDVFRCTELRDLVATARFAAYVKTIGFSFSCGARSPSARSPAVLAGPLDALAVGSLRYFAPSRCS